ncbi:histidine kinase, partial [Streptomyces cellulosae]
LLALVSCAVLPARHRRPLAVLAATTAAGVAAQPLGLVLSPPVIAPALVAAYACTLHMPGERRAAGAVTLAALVLLAGSVPLSGDLSWRDASRMGTVVAAPLVAGLIGHAVRTRRAYLEAVEERARRAEESREQEARRRVAEERVRIARELHDLVAHQITLANAQATVAAHFFDSRPEQTRVSLRELVATTGHALDELRATVGLLRQTGDAGDAMASEGPAPGLARLPDLLESFRRAGLEAAVREEGRARALPPGVDLTAYRIVQEALTNVTKHAAGRGVRVGLDWGGGRLTVTVSDDGGAPAGPPALSDRPPGYGLIGMRERAAAVGGELTAGPRPEGGFLVTARLPLPPVRDGDMPEATDEGRPA